MSEVGPEGGFLIPAELVPTLQYVLAEAKEKGFYQFPPRTIDLSWLFVQPDLIAGEGGSNL